MVKRETVMCVQTPEPQSIGPKKIDRGASWQKHNIESISTSCLPPEVAATTLLEHGEAKFT